jgi:adenylate kinase
MIVVLTGAPGAGKGTQADLLRDRLGFRKISTGDALRKHVSTGTEIGKKAAAIMESGKLVSDEILAEILRVELGTDSKDRILLDGYPRNLAQAEALGKLSGHHRVAAALHLDVPMEELMSRLTGRRVCGKCGKSYHVAGKMPKNGTNCDACGGSLLQRPDDTEEKVRVRLEVYERETKPILDFYGKRDLVYRVDGSRGTEKVYEDLKAFLESL